jgi:predicted outer membrane repeat protein
MNSRTRYGILLASLAGVSMLGLAGGEAQAATITVNTTDMSLKSDSKCGFAEAIVAVNTKAAAYGCPAGTGNDTIQLQAATYVALGILQINRGVTIKGGAPDPAIGLVTQITAQNITSSSGVLFYVTDTNGKMSVTFQNLSLTGLISPPNEVTGIWAFGAGLNSTVHVLGCYVYGFTYGGIYANAFNVDVQDSYVALNSTPESGGGIFVDDASNNLTVSRTTFDSNSSSNYGGAIEYDGLGTSSVVGSTVFQNDASIAGGGIDIQGEGGSFAISQSTIVWNSCEGSASCGGGVLSLSGDYVVNFSMNASIVADNVDSVAGVSDWTSDGNITVSNSDIFGNAGALYADGGGNSHMGQDPQTPEELTRLGGVYRLPLCLLPATSPVIDVLSTLNPAVDERGFTRGVSKTSGLTGTKLFDIGAYEFDPNTETETMVVVGNSGTLTTVSSSTYSAGKVLELEATKSGDYAAFYLPSIIVDGVANYNFVAGFATGTKEGIVQLEMSTDRTFKTGVVAIGSPLDLYAKSAGVLKKNYNVSKAIDSDNPTYVRLRVTGKNTSSGGYAVYSDYVNAILL